jgi:hypothetical protein
MSTDIPKRPCEEWRYKPAWAVVVDFEDCSVLLSTHERQQGADDAAKEADHCFTIVGNRPFSARVVRVELREVGGAA